MINKLICPDDGQKCIHPKGHEEGCWNCLKIQKLLEKMKEVDQGG